MSLSFELASSDVSHSLSYKCVHCETPCASLFRQYTSSPSSIKLTACQTCGNDVDPYIEREWLLVSFDCILMRLPAYRHVLFHRLDSESLSYRRMVQTLLASSILQSYLTWEACRTTSGNSGGDDATTTITTVVVPSFYQLMIQSIVGMWIFWLCSSAFHTSSVVRRRRRAFLAVMIPTSFQVVTVFVLVWENTATVRILGSLLVLVYQVTGMSVVMMHRHHWWWWMSLALVARALVGRLVAHLIMGWNYQPCAGLEWTIAGERFCLT